MNDEELSLKLFVVLSKAYKVLMARAVKDMKHNGLSENEFMVLELLYHKGRSPLNQIGEKILVTSGGITYTIDKLEGKEYIKRVASPDDRRIIYAEMTNKGKDLMDNIFPAHAAIIQSVMQGLTTEEKHNAITLMKKLGTGGEKI